nr:lysophospholipid acyltransferase family protein [Saprospiraceae bacterium]
LYFISNLLFVVFFYLLPYRKKVVMTNLRNSFPEKSKRERKAIAKDFYKHFCDLIVEALKVPGLSEKEARERISVENPEILEKFYAKNKSVIAIAGHFNNWELAAAVIPLYLKHRGQGLFSPLRNRVFNDYMVKSRSKFGIELIPKREVTQRLESGKDNPPSVTFFLSDQVPKNPRRAYWTKFLHQDTGVPFGAGIYAVRYDCPVIYGKINKVSRGHYRIRFEIIESNPTQSSAEDILEKFTRKLEAQILKEPAHWLWTHKRWKRKKPLDMHAR